MTKLLTLLLLAVAVLTACGSESDDSASSPSPAAVESDMGSDGPESVPVLLDDADLVEQYGLTGDGSGGWYVATLEDGAECEVLLLNGATAVDTYAGAGDAVATNPERTIGFKIAGDNQRTCFEGLSVMLENPVTVAP